MLPCRADEEALPLSRLAAALALLAAPALAPAHELWLERDGEGLALRSGHRGHELVPLEIASLRSVRCAEGASPPREALASARAAGREIHVAARCEAASAALDGGFWSLTPDGEVNLPRSRVVQAVRSWQSRRFAKWVDARSPRAGTALGDELEILPASDLSRARSGDKVTLRVLHAGKPAPRAAVAATHRALGETDGKGEIRVRLREAGTASFAASLRLPLDSPEAEALVLEASLTFEVAR